MSDSTAEDSALPSGSVEVPRKRGRPPGNRRNQLVALATARFADSGFSAATVRDIAKDANMLSGSLYNHFDTKEDILDEIIAGPLRTLNNHARIIGGLDIDSEKKLVSIILVMLHGIEKNRDVHAILFHERRLFKSLERFQYVDETRTEIFRVWCSIIDGGVEAGLFKQNSDAWLTVSVIMRMIDAFSDWLKPDDLYYMKFRRAFDLEQLIDFQLSFVLDSVRVDRRRNIPIPRLECEEIVSKFITDPIIMDLNKAR